MAEQVTLVEGKKRRTRVEVFVFNKSRQLLCYMYPRSGMPRLPELPGGGVDEGETPITAAMREVAEESGWRAKEFTPITVKTPSVYTDIANNWYVKDMWDEEEHIAVLAQAIAFLPDIRYGSENDGNKYVLTPVDLVIKETKLVLSKKVDSRTDVIGNWRLAVFDRLLK